MTACFSFAGRARALASAALLVCTAQGCTGSSLEPAPPMGLSCLDDSPHCLHQRNTVLKTLMEDKQRGWIKQPATAEAYASGVRMFAFKQRKREMSCDELKIGRREAESAPTVLRGSGAAGLTPAQVSRGVMFGQEVARELGAELARRCKA